MAQDDDLTKAWCAVKALWPDTLVTIGRSNGQLEIVFNAEPAPQARRGEASPAITGKERVYGPFDWEKLIRAAGKGEGVNSTKVETAISGAKEKAKGA
jgi:hypothetical protein